MRLRNLFSKTLLIAFAFLSGYELCLPVVPEDAAFQMPYFATKMELPGGLTLKELVLCIHALINPALTAVLFRWKKMPRLVAIYLLFLLGGFTSILLNFALNDLPPTLRFAAMGYCVIAVQKTYEDCTIEPFVVALIMGIALSMAINLGVTFLAPRGQLGLLPLLYGQNGPGGFAGAFIGLSFLLKDALVHLWTRIALGVMILLALVVVIVSYSKLGMLMGLLGMAIWLGYSLLGRTGSASRVLLIGALFLSVIVASIIALPESVRQQAQMIYEFKFYNEGEGILDAGDMQRWAYYPATREILLRHPLGVSYSGIGPALLKTDQQRLGNLDEEESLTRANPHNSFLLYIASNGILGLIATITWFAFFLTAIRWHLINTTAHASYIWILIVGICIVYTNTLPSFFNTFALELTLLIVLSQISLSARPGKTVHGNAILQPETNG